MSGDWKEVFRFCLQLRLSKEQVLFLRDWTEWENRILDKLKRGEFQVEEQDLPMEMFKKATAVGVPLSALYASGSVVGFSAAGITSGLAYIGNATLLTALGVNPMTAGIVALIVGGIAVKKMLDAVFPTCKVDRDRINSEIGAMHQLQWRYLYFLALDQGCLGNSPWWQFFGHKKRRLQIGNASLLSLLQEDLRALASESTANGNCFASL